MRTKADAFLLFLKHFLEKSIDLTLCDLTVKAMQNWEGKSVYNWKIDWIKTECGVWQIVTIICLTYVQKDFQIQTLIKQLLTKYQIFMKSRHMSNFHENRNFLRIIKTF